MEALNLDMILVMAMIAVAVFLFIVEWVRVDVVAILVMVALPLLKLVTPAEAFSGLSSNAVVSIIAVIIIGAGLDRTGVVNNMVAPVLRVAGNSRSRVVIAISLTVAGISSFMQNIGAAALFLPAIQRVSKKLDIPICELLMPVGFSAILGGTITLVGCSPLILLNDLMAPFELEPFGLFDVTPIGLALVGAGIASFIALGRFILPHPVEGEDPTCEIPELKTEDLPLEVAPVVHGRAFEVRTPNDFTHYRDPITVQDLRERYLVNVVAMLEPPDFKVVSPSTDTEIHSGMDLAIYAREEDVRRLVEGEGFTLKEGLHIFTEELGEQEAGTVAAVVGPRSALIGTTLREAEFEERYQVTPITIGRHREVYRTEIDQMPLRVGDVVQLHGSWRRLHFLQQERDLLFDIPVQVEEIVAEKAYLAAFWLVVALTMVIGFKIQLSVCLMTGALGMILTRVLTIDEAYESVDWRTIFLLAGLIPLGLATEKTGTAAWIAHAILGAIGTVPPVVLIFVIGLLTTFFTLVISNVGATVLLVPLVVNMALAANADPRMAALAVGLAASNSFVLPTHQVNALYMGPGGYSSRDFLRAGGVVSVLFLVVMIVMMYLVFGL